MEHALATLLERVEPDLVIASGDLTHRGRRPQHELAHGFLTRLGPPVHAVPGNHDIPYGAFHAPLGGVRAALGDDRARLHE